MTDQETPRQRILTTALERFFQFGFSSVTMDEIAADLGMSKKTLYQHFAAKKDLLREGLQERVEAIAQGLDRVIDNESTDYPMKLAEVMKFMSENLPRPSRRFLRDVARSAPEVWRPVHEKRAEVIRTRFGKLFRQGVGEGLLREDLEVEFLILAFTALVQKVVNPETLAELPVSIAQAFEKLYSILLLGVLTEKAREKYLDLQTPNSKLPTPNLGREAVR